MTAKPACRELLPCPFCGCTSVNRMHDGRFAECAGCGVFTATEHWNRRATPPSSEAGKWVADEILAPFLAAAKRMDGYNVGLATMVSADVVKGRVVFALDALWVQHWRDLLAATATPSEPRQGAGKEENNA